MDEPARKLEDLEQESLGLPRRAGANLARVLLLSLEGTAEEQAENERVWAEEAARRYQEIRDGEVAAIPSDQVLREARAQLQ